MDVPVQLQQHPYVYLTHFHPQGRHYDPENTQENLPRQDAPLDVIRRALRARNVCFYFAYGLACPHVPTATSHEASGIPYAWYRQVVSSNLSGAAFIALRDVKDAYGPQVESSSD